MLTKTTTKVAEKQRRQKYVFHMISHLFLSLTICVMQKRIDPAMLPGNKALTARIAELRDRWRCNDKTCRTGSDYCYVSGSMVEHYALSHAHLDVWAAALVSCCILLPTASVDPSQLKPDTNATITMPPNHAKFSDLSNPEKAPPSLLQQRRQAAEKNNQPVAAPPVHIHLPQQAFGAHLYQPAPPLPAVPGRSPLLSPNYNPGPRLSINDFCSTYSLGNDICMRLTENGFSSSLALRRVTVDDLKEMGFKMGEVAEIEEAVEAWAARVA
jgi:hypothetical protein